MSKMSELDLTVKELRNAAQSLTAVADSLAALFSGSGSAEAPPTQSPATKAEPKKPKPITLEQVRAVLAEKSRDGHTAKVRVLLEKYGAAKLSEIDPGNYADLLADAEVMGDG